mmetsp:Transcript_14538/g.37697  ORF Transcript_14538/g.37697 Transcript_14538/m.37697 type:complete len:258 (+) Transcript_14538:72-845(+)
MFALPSAEAAYALRLLARLTPRGAKLVIAPALDAASGLGYDAAAVERLVRLDAEQREELWLQPSGSIAYKLPPPFDHETAAQLLVGTTVLLRSVLRSSTPVRFIEQALRDEAHLPEHIVPLLMKAIDRARQSAERSSLAALTSTPMPGALRTGNRARAPLSALLPTYAGLRWRIDVVISSSTLHRVLRPHMHMQLAVLDGMASADQGRPAGSEEPSARLHSFHCSVSALSQLRRAVAAALLRVDTVSAELAQMPSLA